MRGGLTPSSCPRPEASNFQKKQIQKQFSRELGVHVGHVDVTNPKLLFPLRLQSQDALPKNLRSRLAMWQKHTVNYLAETLVTLV
jgi:hypothetical protein